MVALLFPHKRRIGPMSSAAPVSIRMALPIDVDALFDLEMFCFDGDRLSRRSLAYFVRHAHADVMVALLDGNVIGYAIVMYRRGTRLARLYSLAVHPAALTDHHFSGSQDCTPHTPLTAHLTDCTPLGPI